MEKILHYKKILIEEKERLEEELGQLGRQNLKNPADWKTALKDTDMESSGDATADRIETFEENDAILSDLEIRYRHVLAALALIEKGTYGLCKISDEKHPIESERLDANPAAQTCKAHKDLV